MKKKIIIISIIVTGVIVSAAFASYIIFKKRSIVGFPLSYFIQQIQEQRYVEKKGIRVFLKKEVSSQEGFLFAQELNNILGVNGVSLTSKRAQELMEENVLLYPEEPSTLIPGSHIIIDVFVENIQDKETIIQQIKKYPQVETVADLKPQ